MLDSGDEVLAIRFDAAGDPTGARAAGEVFWSAKQQRGFMRLRGLAVNDPARAQYQLWIFDRDRDDRYPVDGGVFDIPDGRAEVVVPIRSQLDVRRAAAFAVTIERPGGVVVSDRARIALLAKTG